MSNIKIAYREFCDEKGSEMVAWADHLPHETPDFVMVGDKVVSLVMAKVALFKLGLEYGIGTPNKQAKDGGHHALTIAPRYALGVDPVAMREANEAAEVAKGIRIAPAAATGMRAGVAQPVGKRPVSALMKASGAIKAFKDDEGNILEMVTDQDLGDRPDMDIPSS